MSESKIDSILRVVRIGTSNKTVNFTPMDYEDLGKSLNNLLDATKEFFETVATGKSVNH